MKTSWDGSVSESEYAEVVERWNAIENEKAQEDFYRSEVFPRSCSRVRMLAADEPVELLFVPVGTQSYPPIIACLGQPANHTVLLHSGKSRVYAQEVRDSLCGEREGTFHLILIDEHDPLDIAAKIQACHDSLGQPPPEEVVCDQTGGNKIMTSTVAGLAALNGWCQTYVRSEYQRGRSGSYNEQILTLPNLFQALGGWHKTLAFKLAGLGQFKQAAQHLEKAIEEALESAEDTKLLSRFKLAGAYRDLNLKRVVRSAAAEARRHKVALPARTVELLKGNDHRGLQLLLAGTCEKEGHSSASASVLGELTGAPVQTNQVKALIASLKKEKKADWQLRDWQPVDTLLGYQFSKEMSQRG